LDSTIWVVVEFDLVLVLFELLYSTESLRDFLISLVFFTLGITFDGLLSFVTRAGNLDVPPQITFAVQSDFSLAR
jgi:hypothetical protein